MELPTGGGAVRGIDEKFSVNSGTGTGSLSVPVATSTGRSGFGPRLNLTYDSGFGNGVAGLGWRLDLVAVSRRTEKGLPGYDDARESDVFVMSGLEDLVPVDVPEVRRDGYTVRRYRPRVESSFSRIERWSSRTDPADVFWRTISADNVLTRYGGTDESRVRDPDDPARIFSWLICEQQDDKGNAISYGYRQDDAAGVDVTRPDELARGAADSPARAVNRYLKRIRYGNRRTALDPAGRRRQTLTDAGLADDDWLFEVVFDYGDHDPETPTSAVQRPWPARADAFSSRRAGFEVRTLRLLRRVLMFHHFPDEDGVGRDCLVRSTDLSHTGDARLSLLTAVGQTGYRRDGEGYLSRSIPPLQFDYSEPELHPEVRTVASSVLGNLPEGIGTGYEFVDLHGDGVAGVLAATEASWLYQRNESPALDSVRFGPVRQLPVHPNQSPGGQVQLLDLAGDGTVDLVALAGPVTGFWEHDDAEGWHPFAPFAHALNRDFDDPDLRLVDLDGDGHADVLIAGDDALVWHRSLDEAGFEAEQRRPVPGDDDAGPRLVFSDLTESIHLADMTGDGLTDLVRVRNGNVCYWPNLGYGRFGAKVTMHDSPRLAAADAFSPERVRIGDVDGTGPADLVYLDDDGALLFLNLSGNGWSPAHRLQLREYSGQLVDVSLVDLLGTGTACLVWSSPLPSDVGRQLRYVDLLGSVKPFLLTGITNNLGTQTLLTYAPSTRFSVRDRLAGRPWRARLPFPVHVVERVETLDLIGRNRFCTRYAYHDGYFDGIEREFRGFAFVEEWNHENYEAVPAADWTNLGDETDVPPVYNRTWFHVGAPLPRQGMSADAPTLPEPDLPAGLAPEDRREALRALRGLTLRREVYALDGTDRQEHPYVVTEERHRVAVLQPRGRNRHAVVHSHVYEAVNTHLERDPLDPRVEHKITLEVDGYGLVRRDVLVACGRRRPDGALPTDSDRVVQGRPLVVYSEHAVTQPVDDVQAHPDDYAVPRPAENLTYELTGLTAGTGEHLGAGDFERAAVAAIPEIAYHREPDHASPQRRVIEWTRVLYRPDDLGAAAGDPLALLALGRAGVRAVQGVSLALALTDGLIDDVLVRDGRPLVPDHALLTEAGYIDGATAHRRGWFPEHLAGTWWLPTGRTFLDPAEQADPAGEFRYAAEHFFLPLRHRDAVYQPGFDTESSVAFDRFDLLPARSTDAVGNVVRASRRDYRVLKAAQVTDPNGNRSEVAFDALGLVVATAVRGRRGEHVGDSLRDLVTDPDDDTVLAYLDDPEGRAGPLLGGAGTRIVHDLWAYARAPEQRRPAVVATIARERHTSDLQPGEDVRLQQTFSYSDGFGRVVQAKGQAEGGADGTERWVGSGWAILNNQGKPVRRYEPFASRTHRFEFEPLVGVSALVAYDPLGRPIATVHPDGSYDKVVLSSWHLATWDVNDTVLLDPRSDSDLAGYAARSLPDGTWYQRRIAGQLGPVARRSAEKAATHANTPTVTHSDPAGRPFLTLADNGLDRDGKRELLATRREIDVEGTDRVVRDADDSADPRGRVAMRQDVDVTGRQIHRWSPDSGHRWLLDDATGQTIRNWDGRGHTVRTSYDTARRKVAQHVTGADPEDHDRELLTGLIDYGEGEDEATARNLRGRVVRRMDQAGLVEIAGYDFKGNLLATTRRLAAQFDRPVDWSAAPDLEECGYRGESRYDALNRVIISKRPAPRGMPVAAVRYAYDRSGRLSAVELRREPAAAWEAVVTGIDYNPKGQRLAIGYANGARTRHDYDPETFRLTRQRTRRPSGGRRRVQDLRYSYDPVGNVSQVEDSSRQAVFFDNARVVAGSDYEYDPTYRLVQASGREHLGQAGGPTSPWRGSRPSQLRQAGDGQAMTRYHEAYRYDRVGNLLELRHRRSSAGDPGWTRRFRYAAAGNRLAESVDSGGDPVRYDYDEHGNATAMPHLTELVWDHRDQLSLTRRQRVRGGAAGDRTYYVYDGDGRRVRKVTVGPDGRPRRETVYLDGVEVDREHRGRRAGQVRHTLDIADGQRRLALVETRTSPGRKAARTTRYQLGDLLGSCVLELDDKARVVSYEEFSAYGTTSYLAVRAHLESPKRFRYNGKERDAESGLVYYGARYYSPWLGRWTACDPMPLVDGTNPYAYARDNPVRYTDATGAFVNEAAAAATGALGFIGADIAIPEPTDIVPQKWVAYAVVAAVAGLTLGGIAAYKYFSDDDVPAPPIELPPEVKPPEAPPDTEAPPEIPPAVAPPVAPPLPPVAPPVPVPEAPPIGPVVPPIGPIAPPVGPIAPPVGPLAPPVTDAPPITDAPPVDKPVPDEKTKPKEGTDDPPPLPKPDDDEPPRRPTIRVYRVEVEGSRGRRIVIGPGGTAQVLGPDSRVLWLNFGQPQRAEEVARDKIRMGAKDVRIRSFEVPLEFYVGLLAIAVNERDVNKPKSNKLRPIISADPPRGTQLGLRAAHIAALRLVIIQGTGREERRP
ncbi:sugar-binding protein [Pseudonocardia sp. RS11V-5]|uniref:SpvB/TcaC N-terminal domain-containing protein n=1 Tax=Pseudonocardia terrae TaxID=2905831 RepID=UPI001E4F214A|nr:SpvB/TcaC N-terminal domain-containing protein [Pseudonocardia terrae]MCE3552395.1 sugar-binding protein [Pseudonocardia terrae]